MTVTADTTSVVNIPVSKYFEPSLPNIISSDYRSRDDLEKDLRNIFKNVLYDWTPFFAQDAVKVKESLTQFFDGVINRLPDQGCLTDKEIDEKRAEVETFFRHFFEIYGPTFAKVRQQIVDLSEQCRDPKPEDMTTLKEKRHRLQKTIAETHAYNVTYLRRLQRKLDVAVYIGDDERIDQSLYNALYELYDEIRENEEGILSETDYGKAKELLDTYNKHEFVHPYLSLEAVRLFRALLTVFDPETGIVYTSTDDNFGCAPYPARDDQYRALLLIAMILRAGGEERARRAKAALRLIEKDPENFRTCSKELVGMISTLI